MIEPEMVASAILDAATDPTDSTKVGAMSVLNTTDGEVMPSLGEAMAKMQIGRQQRDEPPHSRDGDAVSRRRVRAGAWARQRERGVDRRSPARQPSIRVTTAL
jgi:hypothetical protein